MGIRTKINGLREIWQFDNRIYLAANRILFPKESVQIYKFRNVEFITDHSAGDVNGAREVLTSGMYRDLLSKVELGRTLSVLDLGSNNGGFPLLLKTEGFEIDRLVCVEVNPNTFGRLEYNLKLNFGSNYTALNVAVAGSARTIALDFGHGSSSDSIYAVPTTQNGAKYQIEALTFDQIFENGFGEAVVDICKMDVEGAEFEILSNPYAGKLRNCRYLIIEIHHETQTPRDSVLAALNELGFAEFDGELKRSQRHYVHLFSNTHLKPE